MKRMLSDNYHKLSATRDDRGDDKDGGGVLILVARSYADKCLPIKPKLPSRHRGSPTLNAQMTLHFQSTSK